MKKRYLVLAVLGIFSVITYLDRTAMGLTGDAVTKELNLTDEQFGWILFAFTFAYGTFDIPTQIIGVLVIVEGLLWMKIDATKPLVVEEGS